MVQFFQTKACHRKKTLLFLSQYLTAGITRDEAEFCNTKIKGKTMKEQHLVKSKDEQRNTQRSKNFKMSKQNSLISQPIDVSDHSN